MKDWQNHILEIAAFRYRIIADAAESDGEGVSEAINKAAQCDYIDLNGHQVRFSTRTLWLWLKKYKQENSLAALGPKQRIDCGELRAMSKEILEQAAQLRRESPARATRTIIDILERKKVVAKGVLKRSTINRHFDNLGLSRQRLRTLGKKSFRKIETLKPLELVVADFHHGPYVTVNHEAQARKSLLLVFIDHYSRYILEGRYYLHEDFAALRFGFRRTILLYGPFDKLYLDNGPSFQTARFHAACKNKDLNINVVHSKPYQAEGRGVCERFNRTIKEQFEMEVRTRDELLSLTELNGYFEAWLAERYHQDIHSETKEAPFSRFRNNVVQREAPKLELVDELLRLRKKYKVHAKWSTVEVLTTRYLVDSSLRGRSVFVLYDPFDMTYVLIEHHGRILQRALPFIAGQAPPNIEGSKQVPHPENDYLKLLRDDYETRVQAELAVLNLRPTNFAQELRLVDFYALLQSCRGVELQVHEKNEVSAFFRKMRPLLPEPTKFAVENIKRRLGLGSHISVYLQALQTQLVRSRTKEEKRIP